MAGRPKKTVEPSPKEEVSQPVIDTGTPRFAMGTLETRGSSRVEHGGMRELLALKRQGTTYSLPNIELLAAPFECSGDYFSLSKAVELCRKTYYGFSIARNVIDVMSEFANGSLHLKGGSKKSKDFITQWLKTAQIENVKDQFFRENFRSGNVFFWRIDGNIVDEGISTYSKMFAGAKIPIRYYLLDPAEIKVSNSLSWDGKAYHKVLSKYEILRLKSRRTAHDRELYDSLPAECKKQIEKGVDRVIIPIDESRLHFIFYKKQDYEPFAVPFLWPILKDIDWKLELQKNDRLVSQSLEYCILLIKMGAEGVPAGRNIEIMSELFANKAIGRVLVSDWTTEAEFVVPDISAILGPQKYQIVDQDINAGLNNVFFTGGTGEKFSNTSIKVQVFIERLVEARNNFLTNFLQLEINRVCDEVGIRDYPIAYFRDFDLSDDAALKKIYARFAELGILTPDETFVALQEGILPEQEHSLENQKAYKDHREDDLYMPLVGGQKKEEGRPAGSSAPQTTKNVNKASKNFSLKKFTHAFMEFNKLEDELKKVWKEKRGGKIDKNVKETLATLQKYILMQEPVEEWISKASLYVESPVLPSKQNVDELEEIVYEFDTSELLALIVKHSVIDE